MADIGKSVREAAEGFLDFARGKVKGLTGSDNEGYGAKYDRKSPAPTASAAKRMEELAEESARRNNVRPSGQLTPAAKKALGAR